MSMSKQQDKSQENNNEGYYPIDPFVQDYEGHKLKWADVIRSNSSDRLSEWNRINPIVLWNLSKDITNVVKRLMTTPTDHKSNLPRDLKHLIERVRASSDSRLEVQAIMYKSYSI
jgi:hypothetical protein